MLSNNRIKAFISTTHPEIAREFYTKKIGLKLISEDSYGIELEANGAHLRISFVKELNPQPFTVLGWDTEDIFATIKLLNEKRISCERYSFIEQDETGVWTAPDGTRVAWFKDPDGNLLSLSD